MVSWNIGGTVDNTSSWSGPWGASSSNYWYTSSCPMPTARIDLDGDHPIYVSNITAAYTSGPLSDVTIVYQSVETSGSRLFGSSGGTCQLRFKFTGGGTLYVGRNVGNGFTAVRNRDGTSVSGGLVGTVTYAQVATAPSALVVVPGGGVGELDVTFTGSSDNGGGSLSGYRIQTSPTGGSPWTTQDTVYPSAGVHTISPGPGSFYVRVFAQNVAGNSADAITGAPVDTGGGGGQRYDGATWNPLTTGKRYNGTSWIDLTTRKRYDGALWVDISN